MISLKNTKYWLFILFNYIVTYLGKILVIEWEISSLMIIWLYIGKDVTNTTDSINHNNFKYEKLLEGDFKI